MAETEPSLVPLYASLAGGALSLLGAFAATWWSKRIEREDASRQLANAFKGEISALIHIAELRDYAGNVRQSAAWCRATNRITIYSATSRDEYRAVFKGNAAKLGSLKGTLPEQIAIFYTQTASLMEDVKSLDEAQAGTRTLAWFDDAPKAAAFYDRLADLIDDTIAKGKSVVAEINRLYRP